MSAALKLKRQSNLQSLIPQLTQFGLNPTEWQIEDVPQRASVLRLINKDDNNFRMTGVFAGTAERPVWNQIFLTSI